MLRFQHLINAQIPFKVDSQLLNSEELTHLVTHLVCLGNHHRYLFVVYNSDDSIRVLHTGMLEVFEDITEYQLFVPEQEVLLTNRQIFIMFLKSKRAYSAYRREFSLSYYNQHYFPELAARKLMSAFDWELSAKGTDYWYTLHYQWRVMTRELCLDNRNN